MMHIDCWSRLSPECWVVEAKGSVAIGCMAREAVLPWSLDRASSMKLQAQQHGPVAASERATIALARTATALTHAHGI